MRIFFTMSHSGLNEDILDVPLAHAVTDQLRAAFPDEDEEELDMIAQLAAADDSIAVIGHEPFRIVAAADAEATYVGTDAYPSLVRPHHPITWEDIAAIFVDEESAAEDVLAARRGDAEAFDRCAEWDLLWYDPSERAQLAKELRGRL
ncbi:DUF6912 family protein [Flaviflexus huanghaiensis]|uniref:DUF6912 family protein n=1 Tax=Flaviflexus huanghaiensis TaxID=1111473 RepID=UPI0015F7B0E8|nr:hypothetical protein [Flaviflexus huanghaiensis]